MPKRILNYCKIHNIARDSMTIDLCDQFADSSVKWFDAIGRSKPMEVVQVEPYGKVNGKMKYFLYLRHRWQRLIAFMQIPPDTISFTVAPAFIVFIFHYYLSGVWRPRIFIWIPQLIRTCTAHTKQVMKLPNDIQCHFGSLPSAVWANASICHEAAMPIRPQYFHYLSQRKW